VDSSVDRSGAKMWTEREEMGGPSPPTLCLDLSGAAANVAAFDELVSTEGQEPLAPACARIGTVHNSPVNPSTLLST